MTPQERNGLIIGSIIGAGIATYLAYRFKKSYILFSIAGNIIGCLVGYYIGKSMNSGQPATAPVVQSNLASSIQSIPVTDGFNNTGITIPIK